MEKENINPSEKKFGSAQTLSGDDKNYKGIVGETLNHDVSLEELFRGYVRCGINAFKLEGRMMPAAFLICRDYKEEKYKIGIYPMPNPGPGAMEVHSAILKKVISEMKAAEQDTFKLIGVIIGMDAHMSQVPKEKALNADGTLNKNNYVPPREDPNALDVLHFSLEDAFGKHILAYEYIQASDGTVVVKDEPFMDEKIPFNKFTNQGNFGFFFAEPVSAN